MKSFEDFFELTASVLCFGLFHERSRWKIKNDNPVRHDCTSGYWGHACTVDNSSRFEIKSGVDVGVYFKCHGHLSPSVKPGDQVLSRFSMGNMVLEFVEVKNCGDPPDMFFATLKVIGYESNVPKIKSASLQLGFLR